MDEQPRQVIRFLNRSIPWCIKLRQYPTIDQQIVSLVTSHRTDPSPPEPRRKIRARWIVRDGSIVNGIGIATPPVPDDRVTYPSEEQLRFLRTTFILILRPDFQDANFDHVCTVFRHEYGLKPLIPFLMTHLVNISQRTLTPYQYMRVVQFLGRGWGVNPYIRDEIRVQLPRIIQLLGLYVAKVSDPDEVRGIIVKLWEEFQHPEI